MRAVGVAILSLIGVIAVFLAVLYVSGLLSILTAPFRGEVAKNERVEADGSYRIAAYDEFYSMCSSIQSKNDQVKILKAEMKDSTDEERKKQLQSGVTAQQNTKAELVNDYNSKAASKYTAGQFRDSDLPYQISLEEEKVTCNAS